MNSWAGTSETRGPEAWDLANQSCSDGVCRLLVFLSITAVSCFSPLQAATEEYSREYQLKAVCLVRFAQFVEWPARAFPKSTDPIVIGVLGVDPFGRNLDEAARVVGIVRNRPVVVRRFRGIGELGDCHMLFVSPSEEGSIGKIVDRFRGRPVLTVGETPGFAQQGGMITFTTIENKLRFRVNLPQAQEASLQISSKLLRWAEVMGAP